MRRLARRLHIELLALFLAMLVRDPTSALAVAEICGNGIDDDTDGFLDNGCNPEGYLSIRESPLPRSAIGIVAPLSGQHIWTEPADLHIDVAYGPDLDFVRSYNSQVAETDPALAPMGYGWRHNYMSWLQGDSSHMRARLPSGEEVLFTYVPVAGYTPQPGHRIGRLLYDSSTARWSFTTHDGWEYTYWGSDDIQYLESITDPRGYQLALTYSEKGNVETVAAATGAKELRFFYVDDSLSRVEYWADGVKRTELELTYTSNGLSSSKLGGTTIRSYSYDAAGILDGISDASGHVVADFSHVSSTAGKSALVASGRGMVGYKYGDSGCDDGNGVYEYFNLKDNGTTGEGVACDTDAQCGSGFFCGGQTNPGTGTSGLCFRARRCVIVSKSSDDLVGAVSSSCPTCTDTADRAWDTSGVISLKGEKDAENSWTSYLYNAGGYVTKMVENDSDSDAATVPAGGRVTWFFYSSTFPALVTEVRRLSELKPSGTCNDTTTSDCKRTVTTYTTGAQVDTVQEVGFTYNLSGNVTSYSSTTDYDYDAQGRITQVDRPRTDTSYDIIQYTYWTGAGNLQNDYLKEVKRQKNATTFITTTYDGYDYWGNTGKVSDPNANLTCLTYDSNRNVLTTMRVAMANQSSCTADSSDLVTTYSYDSGLNVTKIQYPEGNCTHYEYDARGRLLKVKGRDDCNAASAGDTQEFTYDDNGNLVKTEYKDSSGTVTKRQEKTYGVDGRVAEILNPADTSKKQTLAYKPDGMLESITGEDAIGKTEWAYDNFNRTDAEKRYNTSSTFDTWDLTPGVQLDLPTRVQDDDAKNIDWVWDDMGRKVKQVTPDGGTTILVYDEAGNLTDRRDAQGTADEKTHHFGFDALNRPLGENWGDPICFTEGGNEIQHYYDNQTGCPTGTCVNSLGRLAKVRAKIRCDDGQDDDTFDQWTYFGYDDAGRLVQESIRDDGGRVADQYFSWDKNGRLTKSTAPSGYYQKSVFGSSGSNSDQDKLVEIDRGTGGTDTVLADAVTWYPFGPIKQYRQSNTIGGNKIIARFTWDLAHRPSDILYEQETSGTDLFRIAYTLDAQGRITVRDFTGGQGALQDAYYTYDWQSRVTCDSAASGACPTSGANVKNNLDSSPPYTASSDRKSIKHKNNTAWPLDTYTYTLATGKDQIASITKSNSQVINFGWDARGNRLYDDDGEFTDDRRDFVYDARDNLISVSGKMKISDTVIHNYTVSNAYDHKNRRVFKSLLDTTATPNVESQYFYYYDLSDRLIEIKYTPDITDSSTYQIWQLYWIGSRPVAIFETTYPAASVARRFFHTDHLDTPLEMYSWPNSGDAGRAWAYNPDAFGWGDVLVGAPKYQPLRFPGQLCDEETTAVYFDSGTSTYKNARPPLSDNRYRVYDPFTGSYLQAEPKVAETWNSYAYADNSPVASFDPTGLQPIDIDRGPGTNGGGGGGGGGSGGYECLNGEECPDWWPWGEDGWWVPDWSLDPIAGWYWGSHLGGGGVTEYPGTGGPDCVPLEFDLEACFAMSDCALGLSDWSWSGAVEVIEWYESHCTHGNSDPALCNHAAHYYYCMKFECPSEFNAFRQDCTSPVSPLVIRPSGLRQDVPFMIAR